MCTPYDECFIGDFIQAGTESFTFKAKSFSYHNDSIMEADWKQVQPQTLTMEQDYQNLQNTILNNNNNNNNINNNNNNNIINNNNNKNQPKKVKKQPSKKEAIQPKNEQKQAASTKPDCINNGIVVVKQELVEDQTSSDSGISPKYSINDGSVSPQSDSSTALVIDCSISPERPVSNGSNDAVQMNVDAYCPNNVSPPMNYTGITPANLETISAMEAIGVDIPSKMEFSKDPLSCPLCVYVTVRKISFSEHLKTHCVKVHEICKPYEFNRAVFKQLTKGSQLQKFYDAASMRLYRTDLGNRVPKIIANKVTVYNCRHCGFRTLTKIEYWQHSREHVKPKKTSTTENKKHNDFHVGDHKGIKPFKCRLCQYACANKSHLDVRQFRCMDCGFSTNYCNQLKTHLRCRGHNQAMVLNPDGTPNPLSFTDVHGTKRGSKAKPKKAANKAQPSTSASPTLDTVQQEQLQQLQQQLLQQLQYQQQLHLQQQQQQYYQQLQQQLLQQQQQQQQQQTSPQGSSDMPQFQLNPEWFNVIMNSLNGFQGFNEQATPALDEVFFNAPLFNDLALACIIAAAINHQDQIQAAAANTEPVALSPVVKKKKIDFTESSGPLDLSKAEDDVQDLSMMNEMQIPVKLTVSTSTDASATPAKPPSKVNRRKGRAFKINPDQVSYYSDEDMPQEVQRASTIKKPMNHPSKASPASSSGNSKDINTSSSSGYRFVCQFCDMSFKDEIMHSIHMGYHDC